MRLCARTRARTDNYCAEKVRVHEPLEPAPEPAAPAAA